MAGYERTIAECGGLDLVVLGIGRNGHIAYNEPGSSRDSRTREVVLAETSREEGGRRVRVLTYAEPVETAREGLHVLAMSGAGEGPALFARALRSPVDAFRWDAVQEVQFLGRGREQTLPALATLLDDAPLRGLAVSAVASLTDRGDVPRNPTEAELDALVLRYKALLREQGHLPR